MHVRGPAASAPGLRIPRCGSLAKSCTTSTSRTAKFGREETAGIAGLIGGIVLAHSDDEQRVARGAAIFDDLYRHFRTKKRG